ncbi:hypothetical protein H8356DRAFT_1421765 [Neocallimastix lanati (nom. inval.)]|nr:hypothetical protein H8356DRAFT_1421765 [Neocallimastix sp. JGI-2020a]
MKRSKYLMIHGADLNMDYYKTSLIYACQYSDINNSDIDYNYNTPLLFSCYNNNIGMVNYLVYYGAEININDGYRILMINQSFINSKEVINSPRFDKTPLIYGLVVSLTY